MLPVATYTCIRTLLQALTSTLCGCRASRTVMLCCYRCSHEVRFCWHICVDHCSSLLYTVAQQDSLRFLSRGCTKSNRQQQNDLQGSFAMLLQYEQQACAVMSSTGCKRFTCCRIGSMGNMLPQTATPAYPSSASGSRKVCHSVVPSKA